jgi:hypothetical protein
VHALASDFTVALQFSQREPHFLGVQIKLPAQVVKQISESLHLKRKHLIIDYESTLMLMRNILQRYTEENKKNQFIPNISILVVDNMNGGLLTEILIKLWTCITATAYCAEVCTNIK